MCIINITINVTNGKTLGPNSDGRYRKFGDESWIDFVIDNTDPKTPDITIPGEYNLEVDAIGDTDIHSGWEASTFIISNSCITAQQISLNYRSSNSVTEMVTKMVYIPISETFQTADSLYSDSIMTEFASNGIYSDGEALRKLIAGIFIGLGYPTSGWSVKDSMFTGSSYPMSNIPIDTLWLLGTYLRKDGLRYYVGVDGAVYEYSMFIPNNLSSMTIGDIGINEYLGGNPSYGLDFTNDGNYAFMASSQGIFPKHSISKFPLLNGSWDITEFGSPVASISPQDDIGYVGDEFALIIKDFTFNEDGTHLYIILGNLSTYLVEYIMNEPYDIENAVPTEDPDNPGRYYFVYNNVIPSTAIGVLTYIGVINLLIFRKSLISGIKQYRGDVPHENDFFYSYNGNKFESTAIGDNKTMFVSRAEGSLGNQSFYIDKWNTGII